MANILLTSCGFLTENIKNQFLGLLPNTPSGLSSVIITTASVELKENNKYIQKAKKDFDEMGFAKTDFLDIEFDDSPLLKNYEVIYIAGGNPFYLLHHLKKSGAFEIFKERAKEDVVIVGVSAGAMVLGKDIEIAHLFTEDINTVNLKDFNALQIIDTNVFPHYDREDLFLTEDGESIESRLKNVEEPAQCKVLRLRDDEAIVMKTQTKPPN